MKKVVNDIRLMTKVCDLYYNQNIGQQQISELLKISRPTISRLLTAAKEQGVVKITVTNLDSIRYWELESRLKELFGLKDVLIADTLPNEDEKKDRIGQIAGRYLEYLIKDGSVVGISMGSTLRRVVSHVSDLAAQNVTFLPLVGGVGQLQMDLHANSLAERLSRKFNGVFLPLHAPARVSSAAVRDELLREDSLSSTIGMMEKLDVAVVGIGYPNEGSSIEATGYYGDNEIESLLDRGVVGEICMQFYDVHGDTTPFREDNNVIGLEIPRLRKVPISVGVAGGTEKAPAIRGAIEGKYINVLVTDYQCASALAAGMS